MLDENRPQQAPTAPADQRMGWPEVVAGVVTLGVIVLSVPPLALAAGADPQGYGLVLSLLSGVAALGGVAVALLVRRRPWRALGLRRASWRYLLAGVVAGLLCYPVKALWSVLVVVPLGYTDNVQTPYYEGAAGGILPVVLTMLFLSVITPIGEELLFRGVVANALLRYGPVVGVVGSAVFFALAHADLAIFGPALVVGLFAAELLRRSGSVWPGIVVHVVNNLGIPVLILTGGL